MMAHKHLHELLQEDQEPFLLKNYIADRRSQLNRPNKPIVQKSNSKHSLYKKACFFSIQDSPDVWKSPVLNFPATAPGKSPRKCPIKSPNGALLHIPARTASLLLDAATRVHKQSSYAKHRKTQEKNVGIGLIGSIIKRLSAKKRVQKGEIEGKSEEKSEKLEEIFLALDEKSFVNSRRCSAVWSESNVDLESSSSSRSEESEEIGEYGDEERESMGFDFCEKRFCSSPLSPFRFALQTSPSPGRRTPVFSSPATSPIYHKKQEETCETESIQQIHLVEEEKEQFSPVSVLDPPFEDDDDGGDGNEDGDDEDEDEDGYDDIECSYAIVQRAKHQLLQNLRRFEKLAELDPIELEKRMLEEQDENDDLEEEEEEREETESRSLCREGNINGYVREVLNRLGLHLDKLPEDMTRLVLDLISEEKRDDDDIETVAKRVCERLDSWKEVKSNTIDMMVELNFRGEIDGWTRSDKEQVDNTAVEIEVAILGLLLEELSGEMVYC